MDPKLEVSAGGRFEKYGIIKILGIVGINRHYVMCPAIEAFRNFMSSWLRRCRRGFFENAFRKNAAEDRIGAARRACQPFRVRGPRTSIMCPRGARSFTSQCPSSTTTLSPGWATRPRHEVVGQRFPRVTAGHPGSRMSWSRGVQMFRLVVSAIFCTLTTSPRCSGRPPLPERFGADCPADEDAVVMHRGRCGNFWATTMVPNFGSSGSTKPLPWRFIRIRPGMSSPAGIRGGATDLVRGCSDFRSGELFALFGTIDRRLRCNSCCLWRGKCKRSSTLAHFDGW